MSTCRSQPWTLAYDLLTFDVLDIHTALRFAKQAQVVKCGFKSLFGSPIKRYAPLGGGAGALP